MNLIALLWKASLVDSNFWASRGGSHHGGEAFFYLGYNVCISAVCLSGPLLGAFFDLGDRRFFDHGNPICRASNLYGVVRR
jgi:hypothetical protein